MRASRARELEKFWHVYILKVLFLSIFFRYKKYVLGIILAFVKSAISFNILSVQMICLWYGAIYKR